MGKLIHNGITYTQVNTGILPTPTINLHSGKINTSDGSIVADADYYYSDLFDAPNGYFMFSLGEVASQSTYQGVLMYSSEGVLVDYWAPSDLYRRVYHATYYSRAPKFRVSFKRANLSKVVMFDEVNGIAYGAGVFKLDA